MLGNRCECHGSSEINIIKINRCPVSQFVWHAKELSLLNGHKWDTKNPKQASKQTNKQTNKIYIYDQVYEILREFILRVYFTLINLYFWHIVHDLYFCKYHLMPIDHDLTCVQGGKNLFLHSRLVELSFFTNSRFYGGLWYFLWLYLCILGFNFYTDMPTTILEIHTNKQTNAFL